HGMETRRLRPEDPGGDDQAGVNVAARDAADEEAELEEAAAGRMISNFARRRLNASSILPRPPQVWRTSICGRGGAEDWSSSPRASASALLSSQEPIYSKFWRMVVSGGSL